MGRDALFVLAVFAPLGGCFTRPSTFGAPCEGTRDCDFNLVCIDQTCQAFVEDADTTDEPDPDAPARCGDGKEGGPTVCIDEGVPSQLGAASQIAAAPGHDGVMVVSVEMDPTQGTPNLVLWASDFAVSKPFERVAGVPLIGMVDELSLGDWTEGDLPDVVVSHPGHDQITVLADGDPDRIQEIGIPGEPGPLLIRAPSPVGARRGLAVGTGAGELWEVSPEQAVSRLEGGTAPEPIVALCEGQLDPDGQGDLGVLTPSRLWVMPGPQLEFEGTTPLEPEDAPSDETLASCVLARFGTTATGDLLVGPGIGRARLDAWGDLEQVAPVRPSRMKLWVANAAWDDQASLVTWNPLNRTLELWGRNQDGPTVPRQAGPPIGLVDLAIVDLNGDGRDDLLVLDGGGQLHPRVWNP